MNEAPKTLPAIGTVLCAVDGSQTARAALYIAAGLAQHRLSHLVIVRIDPRARGSVQQAEAARVDLEEVVHSVLPGSMWYSESTTLSVRAGEPASAILTAARECEAALVVMGTRGRSAVGRAVFGSTTAQVLRDATLPVAIVPPDALEVVSLGRTAPIPNFGVILVPLDLSERSERQLLVASRLSTGSRHRLLLLHVAQPGSDPATIEDRLAGLAGSLGSAHGERTRIREGPIAEMIALAARKEGAGLIVLGRDRTAAGAIACELLRHTRSLVVVA